MKKSKYTENIATFLLQFLFIFIATCTLIHMYRMQQFPTTTPPSDRTDSMEYIDERVFMSMSDNNTIWEFDWPKRSPRIYSSIDPGHSIRYLDYSYAKQTLYYVDENSRQVYALSNDSSATARVVIATYGNWIPRGLAVDDFNNKIYIGDANSSTVMVYDLSSGYNTVILDHDIRGVKDIAIDINERLLFVLDDDNVHRCDLDGANYRLLDRVPYGNAYQTSVDAIALDMNAKLLYVLNWRNINTFDYDGRYIQRVYRSKLKDGLFDDKHSLIVFGEIIYWFDGQWRMLLRIRNGGGPIISYRMRMVAFASRLPKYEIATRNPCARNDCQHLCLLSSNGNATCACTIGHKLADDGQSCNKL